MEKKKREKMSNSIWCQDEGNEILELIVLSKMASLNDGGEFQRNYKRRRIHACLIVLFGT